MFNKIKKADNPIIFSLALLVFCVIFASCTEEIDSVTSPDSTGELDQDTDIKVLEYKEMGELHNQVLKNLDRKMPLLNNKVQADSFVINFLNSTNEVLQKNGYINRLTKRDVLWLLKKFIELKEENIIDFFQTTQGHSSE